MFTSVFNNVLAAGSGRERWTTLTTTAAGAWPVWVTTHTQVLGVFWSERQQHKPAVCQKDTEVILKSVTWCEMFLPTLPTHLAFIQQYDAALSNLGQLGRFTFSTKRVWDQAVLHSTGKRKADGKRFLSWRVSKIPWHRSKLISLWPQQANWFPSGM